MQKKNLNKRVELVISTIFMFFIFARAASASQFFEIEDGLNFTLIEITPPEDIYFSQFLNKPENWNRIVDRPALMMDYVHIDLATVDEVASIDSIESKSLSEIANEFRSGVYLNVPEYATTQIGVPKENLENFTRVLTAMGFSVKPNVLKRLLLDESVNAMGLPYQYEDTPGQFKTLTGKGVRIAILDTGVDSNHPDFAGRLKFWSDTTTEATATYEDYNGHGTHVASTAAGSGSASGGLYKGVAPEADLYIFKVCRWDDWCPPWGCFANGCDDFWVANAINQAVNQNVDIISMSLGGDGNANNCVGATAGGELAHFNAIRNALNNQIVVVAAAGNNGPDMNTIDFPGCIQDVISVGATFKKDYSCSTPYGSVSHCYQEDVGKYTSDRTTVGIDVSVSSGGSNFYSNSWYGNYTDDGMFVYDTRTGFQMISQPPIDISFQGEHRDRQCYLPESNWWDPGAPAKYDEYWTGTFNNGPYSAIDFLVWPHYAYGTCYFDFIPWYDTYYNTYTCSGTAIPCGNYNNQDDCDNQVGCGWNCPYGLCGCWGVAKACSDRSQDYEWCGTPSTTGCTATWTLRDTVLNFYPVSSISLKDMVTYYSSRGPAPQGGIVIKPDITAPGHQICAANSSQINTSRRGSLGENICGSNQYHASSGTSMATPHVSGMAALIIEANPGINLNDLLDALREGSEKILVANPDDHEGFGRVNGPNAVDSGTECSLKSSSNTGDSGNYPLAAGSCVDYDFWNGVECTGTRYDDYCSGNSLYEYFASARDCPGTWENCEDYEGGNYCSGTSIYKPEWGCSGSPGYCNDPAVSDTLVENCALRNSLNTGDSGNQPTVPGGCFDYTGCSGGSCTGSQLNEYCSGNNLYEYYASGTSCLGYWNNCESSESLYCNSGNGDIYRDEWSCGSSPAYCYNSTDTVAQDCSNTCSDSDGGASYLTKGNVTDNNLCTPGQAYCPSITRIDSCLSSVVLREYTCQGGGGNDNSYVDYDCKNLGTDYFCSNGRCTNIPDYCNIVIGSLPYTITQNNKYYCLTNNLYLGGSTAIKFAADIQNSTLDCLGHNIDGNVMGGSGVLFDTKTGSITRNNTVRNCNITDFYYGLYLAFGNMSIIDNSFGNSNLTGIFLVGGSGNIIKNNKIYNNPFGMFLSTSNYNTISNNIVNGNSVGIYLSASSYNSMNNNNVYGSANEGIRLEASSNYNTLARNTIRNNKDGIFLSNYARNNSVTEDSIYGNTRYDYYLWYTDNKNYFRNTNFTDTRKITIGETNSSFNYNNQTAGNIWLKTDVSAFTTMTRKLASWSIPVIKWNDSASSTVTARYGINGLGSGIVYGIYNNSALTYMLTTDTNGNLPEFTIKLPSGSAREIKAVCDDCAEDSDLGKSFTVKGTCSEYRDCLDGGCNKYNFTDYCFSSSTLAEYYVSGSSCAYVNKTCGDFGYSYYCVSGYCVYSGGGGGGGGRHYRK